LHSFGRADFVCSFKCKGDGNSGVEKASKGLTKPLTLSLSRGVEREDEEKRI
jgi:hypothetical protein